MSLANGLSILFIFSKNQLLVLLIFIIVFVFFPFISALIFKVYFLLLTLEFLISSFSSCFRCRVRLFDFSLVSWGKLVLLWTFPFALLLLNPIGFGLCFHFYLFLWIFSFPFWFLVWFAGYSEVCCLDSICLYFKLFFFFFSCEWSEVAQLCLTLRDPVDCSLPGFSSMGFSR